MQKNIIKIAPAFLYRKSGVFLIIVKECNVVVAKKKNLTAPHEICCRISNLSTPNEFLLKFI